MEKNWKDILSLLTFQNHCGDIIGDAVIKTVAYSDVPAVMHMLCSEYLISERSTTRMNSCQAILVLAREYSSHWIPLLDTSVSDGEILTFKDLSIDKLLEIGELNGFLLAGKEYQKYSSGDDIYTKQWVTKQRQILKKRLGVDMGEDAKLASEYVDVNDLLTARDLRASVFSSTPKIGQGMRQKLLSERPGSGENSEPTQETWLARLLRWMIVALLDHRWEVRHGCSQGLVCLLTGMFPSLFAPSDSPIGQPVQVLPGFIVQDIVCSCICVLALDRFLDISVSNSSLVCPVKESVGQLLSCAILCLESHPRGNSVHSDSVHSDSVPSDSVHSDSVHSDSVPSDSVPSDSVHSDSVHSDSVPSDSVHSDSVPSDSVPSDSVPSDSVHSDSVHSDSVSVSISVTASTVAQTVVYMSNRIDSDHWSLKYGGLVALKYLVFVCSDYLNTPTSFSQFSETLCRNLESTSDDICSISAQVLSSLCRYLVLNSHKGQSGHMLPTVMLISTNRIYGSLSQLTPFSLRTVDLFESLCRCSEVVCLISSLVSIEWVCGFLQVLIDLVSKLHMYCDSTRQKCVDFCIDIVRNIHQVLFVGDECSVSAAVRVFSSVQSLHAAFRRLSLSSLRTAVGDLHLVSKEDYNQIALRSPKLLPTSIERGDSLPQYVSVGLELGNLLRKLSAYVVHCNCTQRVAMDSIRHLNSALSLSCVAEVCDSTPSETVLRSFESLIVTEISDDLSVENQEAQLVCRESHPVRALRNIRWAQTTGGFCHCLSDLTPVISAFSQTIMTKVKLYEEARKLSETEKRKSSDDLRSATKFRFVYSFKSESVESSNSGSKLKVVPENDLIDFCTNTLRSLWGLVFTVVSVLDSRDLTSDETAVMNPLVSYLNKSAVIQRIESISYRDVDNQFITQTFKSSLACLRYLISPSALSVEELLRVQTTIDSCPASQVFEESLAFVAARLILRANYSDNFSQQLSDLTLSLGSCPNQVKLHTVRYVTRAVGVIILDKLYPKGLDRLEQMETLDLDCCVCLKPRRAFLLFITTVLPIVNYDEEISRLLISDLQLGRTVFMNYAFLSEDSECNSFVDPMNIMDSLFAVVQKFPEFCSLLVKQISELFYEILRLFQTNDSVCELTSTLFSKIIIRWPIGVVLNNFDILVSSYLRGMGHVQKSVRLISISALRSLVAISSVACSKSLPSGTVDNHLSTESCHQFLQKKSSFSLEVSSERNDVLVCSLLRRFSRLFDPSDRSRLRSYQWMGVTWLTQLRRMGLSGCLADEMGLGKSVQSIAAAAIAFLDFIVYSVGYDKIESDTFVLDPSIAERYPPTLIICPSSLKLHWEAEISKFIHCDLLAPVQMGVGASNQRLDGCSVLIISIENLRTLPSNSFIFSNIWSCVILDEAHMIRNPRTAIAQQIFRIRSNFRIALTGTPVQNEVDDIWSVMNFLIPDYLGEFKTFSATTVTPVRKAFQKTRNPSLTVAGLNELRKLHNQVLPFILRRTKEIVLKELPQKTLSQVLCELSNVQRRMYLKFLDSRQLLEQDLEEDLRSIKSGAKVSPKTASPLQALLYLRLLCVHPSLVVSGVHAAYKKRLIEDIHCSGKFVKLCRLLLDSGVVSAEECCDMETLFPDFGSPQPIGIDAIDGEGCHDESDEISDTEIATPVRYPLIDSSKELPPKCLIFAKHLAVLDLLEQCVLKRFFPDVRYQRLDGKVPAQRRAEVCLDFNSSNACDSIRILLLTPKSCGLGLNLSAASIVIFVENDWNPFVDLQAMDRAHRIGQLNPVFIYHLQAESTIEQRISDIRHFKEGIASEILTDHNDGRQLTGGLQFALISGLQASGGSSVEEKIDSEEFESMDLDQFLGLIGIN